ncbi:hypothetical protein AFB00_06930 [Pseudonocardia sp. HH130630-07]|nr:hypothetical protein AFB00_06930 [Pseudonocardia sp. HH130630-07]
MCGEAEFAALVEGMVADEAPRLFAIVQEYRRRVDARIAAWGIAFADHAEVVAQGVQCRVGAPEDAVRLFTPDHRIGARVVWCNPDAATPRTGRDDAG